MKVEEEEEEEEDDDEEEEEEEEEEDGKKKKKANCKKWMKKIYIYFYILNECFPLNMKPKSTTQDARLTPEQFLPSKLWKKRSNTVIRARNFLEKKCKIASSSEFSNFFNFFRKKTKL